MTTQVGEGGAADDQGGVLRQPPLRAGRRAQRERGHRRQHRGHARQTGGGRLRPQASIHFNIVLVGHGLTTEIATVSI